MKLTNRTLLITLSMLVLIILISPVFMANLMGQNMIYGGMMNGMMGPEMMGNPTAMPQMNGAMSGWMLLLMILRTVAVWSALIIAALLLARLFTGNRTNTTPLEILQRRYAAGEITQAEFNRMRQELQTSLVTGPPPTP